jgi:hypothetical protein
LWLIIGYSFLRYRYPWVLVKFSDDCELITISVRRGDRTENQGELQELVRMRNVIFYSTYGLCCMHVTLLSGTNVKGYTGPISRQKYLVIKIDKGIDKYVVNGLNKKPPLQQVSKKEELDRANQK